MIERICLFTSDVEFTSIVNGGLHVSTGDLILKQGMPRLLNLYQKYNVKSTFFFTSDIAEMFPDIVKMILPFGHEVACHGFTHDPEKSFESLNLEEQIEHLKKAKKILEDISGCEVVSFRAPALRVNQFTVEALITNGFRYDSSVSPQRMDIFFSFGSINKLKWMTAPRSPYLTSFYDLTKKGNSKLTEIPVSSFGIPYIGTVMRISPLLTRITRKLLYYETQKKSNPVNFLVHPNEVIDEIRSKNIQSRRSSGLITYYVKDVIRQKLKQRNLGLKALELLENEIQFWSNKGYSFRTINNCL